MRPLLLILLTSLVVVSCNKHRNPTEAILDVSHVQGDQAFALETTYTNAMGQQYYFTLSNIYVGQFQITGSNEATFPGTYINITPEIAAYPLGEIAKGHYTGLSFLVGVDSVSNHADPTTFDESSPLHPAHPRYQHWSWNDGYIFFRLEGMADTSASMTAGPTVPFFYHIGLDMNLSELTFATDLHVHGEEQLSIPITIDYSRFLQNLDFRTELRTHTMNNMALAAKVNNNVAGAFTVGK